MANLNDALQRNNPVFDIGTYCQVVDGGAHDSFPNQGASPSTDITNALNPLGGYCIISNQTDKEIEIVTMDIETSLPGGSNVHADRLGIPVGAEGNLMMAFGARTKAYIKFTGGYLGKVVLTWFR